LRISEGVTNRRHKCTRITFRRYDKWKKARMKNEKHETEEGTKDRKGEGKVTKGGKGMR
jgi:hypothetical protein